MSASIRPTCRCSNQTALWQRLTADPELLSIQTNVTEARRTNQVRSQVTFFKPQHVTVRCEASNQDGLMDRRDVKLVSSSRCLQSLVCCAITEVQFHAREVKVYNCKDIKYRKYTEFNYYVKTDGEI